MDTERDIAAVLAALAALERFWLALAGDDDLTLLRLTSAPLHERAGGGAGMCARLRERDRIEPDECRRMGTWSTAYILPDPPPAVGFVCLDNGGRTVPLTVPAGAPMLGRRPVMVLERDGVWRFTGMMGQPGWPEGTREVEIQRGPPKPVH